MSNFNVFETYPLIAPEQYAGSLKGKVAIVTGTSVGIGRAIAKALAAAGASVACVARREPELTTLVAEITASGSGSRAIAIVADVAERGAAQDIVSRTEAELGPVDVLVNNAGIARISPLTAEDADLDIWWRVHEVNVRAPVALIRAVLPGMVERGSGVVLSVSSGTATMALPVMTAYTSSKAAISKFHESLSYELEGTGVLSYAMCPGVVRTELGKPEDAMNKSAMEHPAMKALMATLGPGSKAGTPELAADTVVAVVANERFKVLNGRHFTAGEKLDPVLEELEKPDGGRIGAERLYFVNIGQLAKKEE